MTKTRSAFTALQFIVLLASGSASAQQDVKEQNVHELSSRIGKLFAETKQVCIGRYMINVPSTALLVYGASDAPYEIERLQGQSERFRAVVEEIIQKAQSRRSPFPIGPASSPGSKVGTIVPGVNENHKIIYGVDFGTGAFYQLHSVIVVGNDLYVQRYSFYGDVAKLSSIEDELRAVASNIVPRDAEVSWTKPGVCIDGAFVADSGHSHHERTTLGIRLSEFSDVHFALEMTVKSRLVESDELEPRLRSAEERAKATGNGDWYARIKTFRRGERKIANWKGFEALLRRPPQGKYGSFHEFAFVSHGEPNNPALPVVTLDLYTGVEGDSLGGTPSLNDDEVIELWDRLTESIRPIVTATSH